MKRIPDMGAITIEVESDTVIIRQTTGFTASRIAIPTQLFEYVCQLVRAEIAESPSESSWGPSE